MANEFGPTLERLGVLRDLGEPPKIMNPTYRDRAISATAPVMQWWQSLSPANKELTESQAKAQALKSTKRIFGDIEAENIMDSLGILDFTPAGLVFAGQEAYREFGEAEKPTDYILPTVGLGLSAVEAYPLTKPLVSTATRPLRKFLSNLSSKTSPGPLNPDITRRTFMKGAGAAGTAAGTGALGGLLLKSTSEPIANNLDQLIGQFAKPIVNTFETSEGFPFNIKPERMEELLDKSSKASKDEASQIRQDMDDAMNFNQRYEYGLLQEKVTRSVQLRALQDGAQIVGDDKKYRFGTGGKTIAEPDDVNDIKDTVFDTTQKVNENEIKLIDDFYNSLKEQGYTAQEIFDNPQLVNKFEITTKGSPEFAERLIYRDPQLITK